MFYKKIKIIFSVTLIIATALTIFYLFNWTSGNRNEKTLTPVSVGLKWLDQAQFAGNYVAKEKGFYEANGLGVTFTPFSYESTAIDKVVNGDSMFGITGADELIIARSKGLPIKAIAVIYKINPVCMFSLKESGITKPQDFIGKTVGLERGINTEFLYGAMMSKLGIDRRTIMEIGIGYDASELAEGKVDVSNGYIINEPQLLIERGRELNIMMVANYGVNMYADVVFATEDTLNNYPEITKSFLTATLDGWRYAIENQEESVDIIMKYAKDTTREHQKNMLISSIPLIQTGKSPLGAMEKSEWEQAEKILWEQKIIDKRVNVEEVFTEEFYK